MTRSNRQAKRSAFPCPAVQTTDFVSLGLGCHPSQVEDFTQQRKLHGHTGVQYDEKGNCRVTSKRDYHEATKAMGFHDLPDPKIEAIKP